MKCDYQSCLVYTQAVFDKICAEKENQRRRELKLEGVLELRLDKSSGESSKKYSFDPFSLKSVNKNRKNKLKEQKEKLFKEELVRPCLCDQTWHRCCIRERLVKSEQVACPDCKFEYSVGYTDCFALFNKKRRNYLPYMFAQEVLFFASIWIFALAAFLLTYWQYKNHSAQVQIQWMFFIPILAFSVIILSGFLFALRIKAKYTYREIEDIVVYDRQQKQEFDFDSPAILKVYFAELRQYESQPFYYKKVVEDAAKPTFVSVFEAIELYRLPNYNPLQQARILLSKYI